MNSPKKNMRIVRKTFRHERKGAKKTYSYQKANNQHIIKVRLQHAKQLFSKNPEQLTRVNQELKNKRDNDLQTFRADKKKSLEESKAAYIEQVNTAPLQALTASELKKYRLPRMKDEYRSSKERFKASQKEYRQARRKEIIDSVFNYGQKTKEETNFSRRQSNFQPYESKKSRVKVQVQLSQTERAKQIFQAKQFRFKKDTSQTNTEPTTNRTRSKSGRFWYDATKGIQETSANHTGQRQEKSTEASRGRIRFKRVAKSAKETTKSNRFRYDSSETREKKAARDTAKADYKSRKADFNKGKKAYHFKRPRTKVNLASRFIVRETADLLADNDDLRSIRDIQQVTRKTVNYSKFTYRGGKATVKATRGTYRFGKNRITNLRERTANFRAGRGFRLNDPKRHVNQRIKRYIQRMKQNLVNSFKNTVNFIKSIPQIIQAFIANPINWLIAGGVLLLILMFSAFMSVSSRVLIQQDEFELTKAYQHMTWEDSENSIKSTNGATYYTKIDDVMTYMNYRFQDYRLSDRTSESISSQDQELNSTTGFTSSSSTTGQNETYKQYLSQLWKDLNGGDSIKSMASLYKENGKYGLTKEQIEELDEYKESGAYLGLYELDNPFQGQTVDDVLTMTYRYGYYNTDGKSAMSYHIILEAKQGQVIVAPMDGYIKLDGDDVLIVSSEGKIVEARLRMKDIATGRVQEGQKIYTGEIIGETKSDQGLKLYYQKYNDDKEKLVYVNPAFYFPNVVQVQTTILPSIGQFQGDEVGRAKQVYDFLKAKGASNQFIAAVLGNWSVESSVTSKRAEGDYLSPPVGATESSWDDDAWLSIGGPAIYNGRYPNIIHRGLGLGQWTDTADGSVRHTLLRNYATSKGKKWYDLDLQLEFMMEGDSPYYTNWVKKHMTDTGSPATLAQLFLIYWEGNAGDKLLERQSRAIEWFYQIEKGFSQAAAGTAKVDMKSLESIRGDLYDGIVPGGGDDMGYPWGQCTWGVAKRMNQLGLQLKGRDGSKIPIISTMGNGMDWVATASRLGGETGNIPRDGAIISFNLGNQYGHVALVEKVYADGSFLISETNYNGSAVVTFRTISGADASMSFAYTQK